MPKLLARQLPTCPDLQSVLDCVLHRGLEISGAKRGDVQLINRTTEHLVIEAHRGLHEEFLRVFAQVEVKDGSACARALRNIGPVVIEDVGSDQEFVPYRDIAYREGFRAVVSIPLVSIIGTVVGVLSTHFPTRHRPTDIQLTALIEAGRLATNAIILRRPRSGAVSGPLPDSAADAVQTLRAISESERRITKAKVILKKSDKLLHESNLAIARLRQLLDHTLR
jgi:GAF domain-containing protein